MRVTVPAGHVRCGGCWSLDLSFDTRQRCVQLLPGWPALQRLRGCAAALPDDSAAR